VKFLIDSDVTIDHLAGRTYAVDVIRQIVRAGAGICVVTYGEVFEGILRSSRRAAAEAGWQAFLSGVEMIPVSVEIMHRFARARRDLHARGVVIKDFDILIAMTAVHFDLTLVTRNLNHFDRFDGLKLYSFEQAQR
jgi:predicted nucleic acid-binding protein